MSAALRTGLLALTATSAMSLALAQSSPQYRVSGSSMVTTAGEASSPMYQATLIGGDGSPNGSTSSQKYAVVVGAGNPDPVNAEALFASGFE